jgi:hypothetical protein
MVERLQHNPDKLFQFTNNARVKVLLFELGLIDKFSKVVPGVPAPTEAVTGECSTHYILAILFSGRTKPDDNGYVVYCFPKSQCSAEKASQVVRDILKAQGQLHLAKPFSKNSSEN